MEYFYGQFASFYVHWFTDWREAFIPVNIRKRWDLAMAARVWIVWEEGTIEFFMVKEALLIVFCLNLIFCRSLDRYSAC